MWILISEQGYNLADPHQRTGIQSCGSSSANRDTILRILISEQGYNLADSHDLDAKLDSRYRIKSLAGYRIRLFGNNFLKTFK